MWRFLSLGFLVVGSLLGCARDGLSGSQPRRDMTLAYEDPPDLTQADPDLTLVRGPLCGMATTEGMLVNKPVDIIVVIDNSCSMNEEIRGVEANINVNFAEILKKSGLDYRVIMVTSHGTGLEICVGAPLSKHNCMPPDAEPQDNPPRFYHYDFNIQSTDSFVKLLNSYATPDMWKHSTGWKDYLRKDAIKFFLEITDDKSQMAWQDFDTRLLALDKAMWGNAKQRKYVFHSICGVTANNPVTRPWGPKDPFQAGKCGNGAVNHSPEYQDLSITTGGLRFPICEYMSFDGIFKELAKGIIEGVAVGCELEVPEAPSGKEFDESATTVEYVPSFAGAEPEVITQVFGLNDCGPDNFYVIQGSGLNRSLIVLCPEPCQRVKRDPKAVVRASFYCR